MRFHCKKRNVIWIDKEAAVFSMSKHAHIPAGNQFLSAVCLASFFLNGFVWLCFYKKYKNTYTKIILSRVLILI